MDVDPKRTGVKAQRIKWQEPPMYLENDRWHGPLGAMIAGDRGDGLGLICCPGCGEVGAARDGAKWRATSGSHDDVTTLTLEPSIQKSCCGWHGYLRNGVFESC